jgi:signal transduction histidine kinase
MSNAIKFSPKGSSIDIHCQIIKSCHKEEIMKDYNGSKNLKALKSSNDLLLVSVIDSGAGIKEDDLQKLFMMFGFIDKTKEINT